MKSLILSAVLHAALFVLVAFAPTDHRLVIREEKVIPVNLVTLPPMAPPPEPESPPVRETAPARPAPYPTTRPSRPPARVAPRETAPPEPPKEIVVPDLVSKIETPVLPDTSFKEKIQSRLKRSEPVRAPEPPLPKETMPQDNPPPKPAEAKREPPPAEKARPQTYPAIVLQSPGNLVLQGTDFPHAWYVAIVQNQIYENWEPPQRLALIQPGATALVRFRIHRDGKMSGVALDSSSGYTLLDRSALEAVRGMAGLPPLPSDYKEEYLNVVVSFRPDIRR